MSLRIIFQIFLCITLLGSCISKKEIDPKASIPKCNYRDGDNSSDKVFNEKFTGKKKVVDFLINGVSHMDSLRLAHADSIWEFKYPTEYFNNLCLLTVYGQQKDTLYVLEGAYFGNYIGNNYCRDQTYIIFNDNEKYKITLNGRTDTILKPINQMLLSFKKNGFWSIVYLSESNIILEKRINNNIFVVKFSSL